jgi:hypothetical protein
MSSGSAPLDEFPHLVRSMRRRHWALGTGACALVGSLLGIWLDAQRMLAAYLAAWLFFLGLSLGALAALMVHHLTGGDWGRPVRRYFEAMLAPLPLLAVLFLPLALSLPRLFPWAREGSGGYLSSTLFLVRAFVFFALWLLFGWLLTRAGRDQRRAIGVSAAGIIVYLITATLAATDWIASLTPRWASTNLGLIVVTGQGLCALAFAVAAACGLTLSHQPTEPSIERWRVTPERGNDLGNLLLTFVMTWMYLAFVQLLIIWAEDMPRETVWYVPRLTGPGQYFALAVMLTQFAIPFALLLFRRLKRDVRALYALGIWLLAAHLLDVVWMVLPSVASSGSALIVAADVILASVGVGGIWLFLVANDLVQRPTLAHAALDTREDEARAEVRSHG